jgi:transposase InsO family protein
MPRRRHRPLVAPLARQAAPQSLAELQLQLDTFRAFYNQRRPHKALGGRPPSWLSRPASGLTPWVPPRRLTPGPPRPCG